MYFKITYLAHELSIRTAGDGSLNAYEDSELLFHLGGPHDVVIRV